MFGAITMNIMTMLIRVVCLYLSPWKFLVSFEDDCCSKGGDCNVTQNEIGQSRSSYVFCELIMC